VSYPASLLCRQRVTLTSLGQSSRAEARPRSNRDNEALVRCDKYRALAVVYVPGIHNMRPIGTEMDIRRQSQSPWTSTTSIQSAAGATLPVRSCAGGPSGDPCGASKAKGLTAVASSFHEVMSEVGNPKTLASYYANMISSSCKARATRCSGADGKATSFRPRTR